MEMGPVRHQCLIYDGSPTQHLSSLVMTLKEHLEQGFRCLFLHYPAMVAGVRYYLTAAGVDVTQEVNRGALVLSSDNSHLIDGIFDADRMIEMLADTVEHALADGYKGLFATGDMTWEFGPEKNFVKLLEYERALEQLFQKTPALRGVCQYREDTLPSQAVQDALLSHQAIYINETLSRMSPSYSPSGSTASASLTGSAAEVKEMARGAAVSEGIGTL